MTGIVFGIIILLISIVLHEVAHGYAADSMGDPTARLAGRLTLNPIAHLDLVGSVIVPFMTVVFGSALFGGAFVFGWAKPVPFNPYNLSNKRWGEALVAAAGPGVNLLLALCAGLALRFGLGGEVLLPFLAYVVIINIVLALFNLVPIPPLDGSKILFSILPYHAVRIRDMLAQYGLVLVLIFVLFFWQLLHPLVNLLFWLFTGQSF